MNAWIATDCNADRLYQFDFETHLVVLKLGYYVYYRIIIPHCKTKFHRREKNSEKVQFTFKVNIFSVNLESKKISRSNIDLWLPLTWPCIFANHQYHNRKVQILLSFNWYATYNIKLTDSSYVTYFWRKSVIIIKENSGVLFAAK